MAPVERHRLRPEVGGMFHAIGALRAGAAAQDRGAPGIVGVIDRLVALAEEPSLGCGVALHGAVEIQVVLGEVGEGRHRKVEAIHPVQCQGVGGDLHHAVLASPVRHPPQQAVDGQGVGGGALCGEGLLPDLGADGSHEAHRRTGQGLQKLLEYIGRGGFPVGSGDAHQRHAVGRMTVLIGRHNGQRPAGIDHPDGRGITGDLPVTHHACGALFQSLSAVASAVPGRAIHGHEQLSGADRPGVTADAAHLLLAVHALHRQHFHALKQVFDVQK